MIADGNLVQRALTALSVLAILLVVSFKRRRFLASLPPGPRPLPLLGNLLSIPKRAPWETYTMWAKQLNSDLISIWTGKELTIIISSSKVAHELFEKRANYRDKPRNPMLILEGWTTWAAPRMPYGEEWRAHRRLLHRSLNLNVVGEYVPLQETQARLFIDNIYRDPKLLLNHIKYFAASISMKAAYGYQIAPENDWAVKLAQASIDRLSRSIFPGAIALNTFPFLRFLPDWMPGTGFKAYARECVEMTTRLRAEPFNMVKDMMARGEAPPSSTRSLLEASPGQSPSYDKLVADTASMFFIGGAETTTTALETVMAALAMHPNVQLRAQAEIDAVTARARLPRLGDSSSLPYITAIISEALRWNNMHPLGVFRRTIEDDVYDGYFIPAGATITWNTWAICHDPETYPDPYAFRPERFLDANGQLVSDGEPAIFGYGRRECPGLHFGRNALWLATALTLCVFDLSNAKYEDGRDIHGMLECTDTSPSHPKPFTCDIRSRDEKAAELLEAMRSVGVEDFN